MGCGKSSVGRKLSELLCCPFTDLDAVIEQQTGRTIPEIFSTEGESGFRKRELEALCNIIGSEDSERVLSLGGGTITQDKCAEIIKEKTTCIYLRASMDTLVERLSDEASGRPLLQSTDIRTRIETLMGQRSHKYESAAHHIIDTDGHSIEEVALSIIELLR